KRSAGPRKFRRSVAELTKHGKCPAGKEYGQIGLGGPPFWYAACHAMRTRSPEQPLTPRGDHIMDMNRLTEKAQEALRNAQSLAVRMGHQQIDVEHLMLSLLDQERGLVPAILNKANVSVDALKIRLQRELERQPRVSGAGGSPDQFY